jgi:serine/threonine protein kinase
VSGAWNPTRWLSAPRGSFKPAPGVALAPHLQLVRPVTGAYELNVWVADQLTLQIEVAVKFAPRDAAVSPPPVAGTEPPEDVHRFLRQARFAARIADPHLLQILEQGRVKGGIPFIVTELLEGKSLSQRLLSGPLPISHAHAVLSQAAGVLAKAHPLGLWHGSLWPEHLFLTEAAGEPFLKLANFGDLSAETWANDPASKLSPDAPSRRQAYLSPEQLLQGEGSSAAADIWSLGVLLYELLTTTLPFEAPDSAGVSVAICNAQFSPPSHYRADLPPAVDAWFSRVFAKERSARLLDPARLAREFAQAIGAQAIGAQPIGAQPIGNSRDAPGAGMALANDDDGDERTMRWDLPPDWSLPRESTGSLLALPQEPERPSVLPSSGPPPLPDRPPSSRPPPPYPGYAPTTPFRVPAARLPSLPPRAARATLPSLPPPAARPTLPAIRRPASALRYRVSKGQGLAAGALLGGLIALLAWGIQSWPDSSDGATETAKTLTAPLAAAAPHAPAEDTENLPVILQTDELPRAPEETDEGEDDISGADSSPTPSRTAKSDPRPAARAVTVVKPKAPPAAMATAPRRETPHRSAKPLSASADCNPPYFFDKNNIRRLKLECL